MKKTNAFVISMLAGSLGFVASAQNAKPDAQPDAKVPPTKVVEGQPLRRGAGGALSEEKAIVAWTAQATSVGKRLSLDEKATKSLISAYNDARKSFNTESAKAREEQMKKMQEQDNADAPAGGRGRGGAEIAKAMQEVTAKERAKFEKALTDAIGAEKAVKATASLGTFNRQWDSLTDTLLGFKLDADKQQAAMGALEEFSLKTAALRPAGGRPAGSGENEADADKLQAEREKTRAQIQEAQKKLSDSLKKVLSEEQLKTIEESTSRGGGRGFGGPGGPGGAGGDAPKPPR